MARFIFLHFLQAKECFEETSCASYIIAPHVRDCCEKG